MEIKFVDIQRQYKNHKEELLGAMQHVLEKGDFILGQAVSDFEKEFAVYTGSKYALGVDSGTSALILSVQALGLKEGDEVITVPNSFISTAYAISEAGCKVKFVDVHEHTQLMDAALLEKALTPAVKAVIPVHLFGQSADMKAIYELAQKHGLKVIEDSCQAHGAMHYGKKTGNWGDLGCFSFYPGKNLGAYGDGGAITTNDDQLYAQLRLLRNYGSPVKYYHEFKGKNARLDTLHAAVLSVKLRYLDAWNKRRAEIVLHYMNELAGTGDLILPVIESYNVSCHHLFVVRTKKRDELFKYLNEQNVQTIIHYPVPIHLQKAYSELGLKAGNFPVAEKLAGEILSLPVHPDMTDDEVAFVIKCTKEFFAN